MAAILGSAFHFGNRRSPSVVDERLFSPEEGEGKAQTCVIALLLY